MGSGSPFGTLPFLIVSTVCAAALNVACARAVRSVFDFVEMSLKRFSPTLLGLSITLLVLSDTNSNRSLFKATLYKSKILRGVQEERDIEELKYSSRRSPSSLI